MTVRSVGDSREPMTHPTRWEMGDPARFARPERPLSSLDLMSDINEARGELDAHTPTPLSKADAIAMLRDS